jgi:hypothetical protein
MLFKQLSRMSTPSEPQIKTQPFAASTILQYSWQPPEFDGGDSIQGYELQLSGSSDFGGLAYTVGINSSTFFYQVPGLTNGLTYYSRLNASNVSGNGPWAYFRSFQPGNLPASPSTISTTIVEPSSILIQWTPPEVAPDATIFWYAIISSNLDLGQVDKRITANGLTQNSYFITPVDLETYYNYSVYSVNCPGWSAPKTTNAISILPQFGSMYFNNMTIDTSYLSLSPGIVIGTQNFTAECLFFIPDWPVRFTLFTGETNALQIELNSSGQLLISAVGGATTSFTAPNTLTNKWTHLAISRQGGTIAVWFDGQQTPEGGVALSTNYSASINKVGSSNTRGYLTNIRIVVGSAIYNPANTFFFTLNAPLGVVPGTQLLLLAGNQYEYSIDSSSTQIVSNSSGSPIIFDIQSPFRGPGTAVMSFSASGNYLEASPGITLGLVDFTIQVFFYIYGSFTNFTIIDTDETDGIRVKITTANKLIVSFGDDSGAIEYTLPTIQTNRWYYIVISRLTEVEAAWCDGVRLGSTQPDINDYAGVSSKVWFQQNCYSTNININVNATNYSPEQLFIAIPGVPIDPTEYSQLTLITQTSKNLLKDNGIIPQAISNINNIKWTYLSPFRGPGSAQFSADISSQFTLFPGISCSSLFTVEFFIAFSKVPSGKIYILSTFVGKNNNNVLGISLGDGYIKVSKIDTDPLNESSILYTEPSYVAGTWYHIAISNNSGSEAVWVNGVRTVEGVQSDPNDYTGSTRTISGFDSGNYLDGFITNLRITTGSVIYNPDDSTITVPTKPLSPTGSSVCLQTATNILLDTDFSGIQSVLNQAITWCGFTPFIN